MIRKTTKTTSTAPGQADAIDPHADSIREAIQKFDKALQEGGDERHAHFANAEKWSGQELQYAKEIAEKLRCEKAAAIYGLIIQQRK